MTLMASNSEKRLKWHVMHRQLTLCFQQPTYRSRTGVCRALSVWVRWETDIWVQSSLCNLLTDANIFVRGILKAWRNHIPTCVSTHNLPTAILKKLAMCLSSEATSVLRMEWKPSRPPQNTADKRRAGLKTILQHLKRQIHVHHQDKRGRTKIFCTQFLGNIQAFLHLSTSISQNVTIRVSGGAIHVPVTRQKRPQCQFEKRLFKFTFEIVNQASHQV